MAEDGFDVNLQVTITFPHKVKTDKPDEYTDDEIAAWLEENTCKDNVISRLYEYIDRMLDRTNGCFCNDESLKIKYLGRVINE